MAFSFCCIFLYAQDAISIMMENRVIIYILAFIVSGSLLFVDMFVLVDIWYINNLIAIIVAGSMIKFIVIRKLKSAILPLLLLWLFFILRQCGIVFRLQNFQSAMQIQIAPLFLQIPAFLQDDENGYECSAFGTSKVLYLLDLDHHDRPNIELLRTS
jgi:hypothetical protein